MPEAGQPDGMTGPPRYTGKPFPPYRYIPGKYPHPTRDPEGHSYGQGPAPPDNFTADDWRSCDTWLYGIDLFNHGYWWEAHEALEAVWVAAGRQTPTGRFIQGLIQIGVAHLKRHQGFDDVARRMAREGLEKIKADSRTFLGIDVTALRSAVEDFLSNRHDAPVMISLDLEKR